MSIEFPIVPDGSQGFTTKEELDALSARVNNIDSSVAEASDRINSLEAGGVWRGTFSTYAELIAAYPNLDVSSTGWNHNDFVEVRQDESTDVEAHTVNAPSSYIVISEIDNNGDERQVLTYRRDDPVAVQMATNTSLGVIKGTTNSGGVSITSAGEGRVNGFISGNDIQDMINASPDKTPNLVREVLNLASDTECHVLIGFQGDTTANYEFNGSFGLQGLVGTYSSNIDVTSYEGTFDRTNLAGNARFEAALQRVSTEHKALIWYKTYTALDFGLLDNEKDPVAVPMIQTHTVDNMRHISSSEKSLIAEIPQLKVGIDSVHNSVTAVSSDLLVHESDSAAHVTSAEQTAWTKTSNDFVIHNADTVVHISSAEHTALTELIEGGGGGEDTVIDWNVWKQGPWDMSSTYIDFPSSITSAANEVMIVLRVQIPSPMGPDYTVNNYISWSGRIEEFKSAIGFAGTVRKFTGSGYAVYAALIYAALESGYRFSISYIGPDDLEIVQYTIYYREAISIPGGSAAGVAADLQIHKDSDVDRWKEFYAFKKEMLDFKAGVQNKVLDIPGTEDIETLAQGSGFIVGSALGGRVTFTDVIVLLDLIPGSVSVNGQVVWSGQALGVGEIEDYVDVNYEDVVTCHGLTSIAFTPYVPA